LILSQSKATPSGNMTCVMNVSGGAGSAVSLRELSEWCRDRFGDHEVQADGGDRRFDLPWVVLDSSGSRKQPVVVAATDILAADLRRHCSARPGESRLDSVEWRGLNGDENAMKFGFITLGANVPSTRFRFVPYIKPLQRRGHSCRLWNSFPAVYDYFP
jgi:hypothetical protein